MGGVTELWLREQGVTFERLQPFGPSDRDDLRDALRSELARRTELTLAQVQASAPGKPVPVIVIGLVKGQRAGECITCGDPMLHYRGGQCVLCIIALQRALMQAGRLAA